MKYMILVYASQRDYAEMASSWTPERFAALGAFMEKFNAELTESGELVQTYGLTQPVHTRRIQVKEGAPVVTDGPYAETTEVLAGFWIVDCDGFDRATEIAGRLTQIPGPAEAAAKAYADIRPIAESRHEL
jgi:hypothetical protein